MNQREMVEQVAEQYRKEGYVVVEPSGVELPDFLAGQGIDLIARRGDERVAVTVRSRRQLYNLRPPGVPAGQGAANGGWQFDLVVYPPDEEEVPLNGAGQGPEYTATLIEEAVRILNLPSPRAAYLIAWSALEAALRDVAHREAIPLSSGDPRFVVKTLCANGVLGREEYDRLRQGLDLRGSLIHGVRPDKLEADDARFLVDLARRLTAEGDEESHPKAVPGAAGE